METFGYTRPRISILYVEDDPVTRNILCKMIPLKFPGIDFHSAENGKVGLELYKEHAPDIIITDINMPVMDGIKMAAEIKTLHPDAIIIIVSAYSDTNYLLNAIEIGINHYILKPIDYKKLFVTIDKCIAGIILDNRLKVQNEHIRKLSRAVEQSPSMAMITDLHGTIEYVNPKFTEITGYPAEELIGQTPRILKSDMTPPDTYQTLWSTINSGRVWHGEFLNRKKNGELYWESASIAPVFDEEGVITHFVAVKEDITRRKRAEEEIEVLNSSLAARAHELEEANNRLDAAFHKLESANHQLEMTNRELEAFNYTVSHDLKKPLSNINGYCQVILNLFADQCDGQSRRYLQEIYSGTLRMSKLIDTLLDFSRLSRCDMVREKVDLSGLATEIAAELRFTAPERRASFKIAQWITAYGDVNLLRVVLVNIIGNAWKFSANNEEAVIEFGMMEYDGKQAHFVRDNGVGFDMAQMDELFTPFYRLHCREGFAGHGIGLATVQRIIQRHGGRVWAEGKPDEGATFFFTLPEQ
ncbi:MAG TPA: response regulator [Geobacteraceae bacterium]|nr:response regulator [Geobacteraceae bacterium]